MQKHNINAILLGILISVLLLTTPGCVPGPTSDFHQYWENLGLPVWSLLIPPLVMVMLLLALLLWRRRLMLGSVCSITLALTTATAWIVTYHRSAYVQLTLFHRQLGFSGQNSLMLETKKGTVMLCWEYYHIVESSLKPASRTLTFIPYWSTAISSQAMWREDLALIHSSMLRTCGFQIACFAATPSFGEPSSTERKTSVTVPHWFILLLCAVYPLCWWRQRRADYRRRLHDSICVQCGYDLRAHKPGQRCPECGRTITTPTADPRIHP